MAWPRRLVFELFEEQLVSRCVGKLSDQRCVDSQRSRRTAGIQGRQRRFSNGDLLNYTDWKLGVTWLMAGYNVGAYYSDTNAKDAGYTLAGKNIGKAAGTVFIQKTF
jgi:hypothetical protein